MPQWSDFGGLWSTIRELDTAAIREDADRAVRIVCVGHRAALDALSTLFSNGPQRYPPTGASPLSFVELPASSAAAAQVGGADLLVVAVDGRAALSDADRDAFAQLDHVPIPTLVVELFVPPTPLLADQAAGPAAPAASGGTAVTLRSAAGRTLRILDPQTTDAAQQLAQQVLERLAPGLHLAAARQLPALRGPYATGLIGSTAFANATYAVATVLPEQIPILSVPFAAADMIVLTKNQILMVYRLALTYGAPPDFQARIAEVLPVVGGAFLWRQLARTLIGLIPVWGIVPKVAVAYSGTYATGVAAQRWYANGELVSTDQMKQIAQDALGRGRALATDLVSRTKRQRDALKPAAPDSAKPGIIERIRRRLPGRKK